MVTDEEGGTHPRFIPFAEDARCLMDEFRLTVRGWEADAEGLMLSCTAEKVSFRCGCADVGFRRKALLL